MTNLKILNFLFLFIFLLLSYSFTLSNPEKYCEVKIFFQNKEQVGELARQGLIFDHVKFAKLPDGGFSYQTVLNSLDLQIAQNSGLRLHVIVDDVIAKYQAKQKVSIEEQQAIESVSGLQHFELGSMGGNYTYAEIESELDSMHLLYPNLVTEKKAIGTTHEGRTIWMAKISDNPDVDENEAQALYDGLHHAREPQGMMTVIYFMYYLLENYSYDPVVAHLVDNRELYFVPCVNPDGYVYNQTTNPGGGGQWRKNRRDNGKGSYGVDLNRNYGYMWGYDNEGSSNQPWSDTYRGPSAFSEPETQTMRNLCNDRQFALALNYHSYSNLLIYPWGYVEQLLTPDSVIYIDYAVEMTENNHYLYGTGDETVGYVTNGDSDDWMYGEQISKNKILAMTPEVGSDADGFWPDESRIVPIAQENLSANLYLAWAAGGMITLADWELAGDSDSNGYPDPGEQCALTLQIQNIGQADAENITLNLKSADPYVTISNGQPQTVSMAAQTSITLTPYNIDINPVAPQGYRPKLYFEKDYGSIVQIDSLRGLVIGSPTVLFTDNAENGLANWNTGQNWNTSQRYFVSGTYSFTDSPSGFYAANADNSLTIKNSLALPAAGAIYLEFRSRWYLERQYDFAQVEVSTDGSNWTAQSGLFTKMGSGNGVQSSNQEGYDGLETDWIKEQIDLTAFAGSSQFYFRFRLRADGGAQKDGWHIDDIHLSSYQEQPSAVMANIDNLPQQYNSAYPNPFNSTITFVVNLIQAQDVKITIFDINGRKVDQLNLNQPRRGLVYLRWTPQNLASGLYFADMIGHPGAKKIKIVYMK